MFVSRKGSNMAFPLTCVAGQRRGGNVSDPSAIHTLVFPHSLPSDACQAHFHFPSTACHVGLNLLKIGIYIHHLAYLRYLA